MSWIHLDGSEKPHFQTPNHSDVNPRIQCPSWGPMLFSSPKKVFCPTAALISQWHLFLPILGCIKSHSWVFCHYEPLFTAMNPMIIPFYSHSHTKVRASCSYLLCPLWTYPTATFKISSQAAARTAAKPKAKPRQCSAREEIRWFYSHLEIPKPQWNPNMIPYGTKDLLDQNVGIRLISFKHLSIVNYLSLVEVLRF